MILLIEWLRFDSQYRGVLHTVRLYYYKYYVTNSIILCNVRSISKRDKQDKAESRDKSGGTLLDKPMHGHQYQ